MYHIVHKILIYFSEKKRLITYIDLNPFFYIRNETVIFQCLSLKLLCRCQCPRRAEPTPTPSHGVKLIAEVLPAKPCGQYSIYKFSVTRKRPWPLLCSSDHFIRGKWTIYFYIPIPSAEISELM